MSNRLISPSIIVCLLPLASQAAELFDPVSAFPCSSITGQTGSSTYCKLLPGGDGLDVTVKAQQLEASNPAEASEATVTLSDGRPVILDGVMLYNGHFVPEVWRIAAGQRLRFTLNNELAVGDQSLTNIHTHGLLVAPDLPLTKTTPRSAIEPVGDTVYVCTEPAGQPSSSGCASHGAFTGPNAQHISYELPIPTYHPDGLFWYHPHVHMNARHQVGSGLSGMIYVLNDQPGGGHAQFSGKERFIMLKDIQIEIVAAATGGRLRGSVVAGGDRDPGICGLQAPDSAPYAGFCESADKSKIWLFLVNGQSLPSVTVASGVKEAWRIVNTSPDMTYDLALIQKGSGRPLKFQVLARDGISANTSDSEDTEPEPVLTDRALLMPGARIEIAVDRSTAEWGSDPSTPIQATLRTYGYFTGDGTFGPDGSAMGDKWPTADLIDVLIQGATPARRSAPAPMPSPMAKAEAVGSSPIGRIGEIAARPIWSQPVKVSPWIPPAGAAKAVAPSRATLREAVTIENLATVDEHQHGTVPHLSNGPDAAQPQLMAKPHGSPTSSDPCNPLRPGWQRVVALTIVKNDQLTPPEQFKIGASCAPSSIKWPPPSQLQDALKSAAMFGEKGSPTIHTNAGRSEIWTIYNPGLNSNHELHNFHIHQMKYEILEVYDPSGRITAPIDESASSRKVDSFPVPIGGYLRIRIHFTPDMIGKFVFHCHILEHEDKGMMAQIVVQ